MKKKVNVFGKSIPVLAIFVLGIALVSAALIPYFATMTGSVVVLPAITIDGVEAPEIEHVIQEAAPGGELFCFLHKVRNDASINVLLGLDTKTVCTLNGESTGDKCAGITTQIYTVPETTTLNLCEKDSNWKCNSGATATLTFDTVNPKFVGELTISGLNGSTQYALIYYPDNEDRFASDKWNGAGGEVIETFMGSATTVAIDIDLGRNLPHAGDWNINPSPNYCDKHNGWDDYVHCRGAKLWIVPTSDLTGNNALPLTAWNPGSYLFETDLITYSDCDFPEGPPFVVDMVKGDSVTELTTKSKTMTPMLVCYDFDVMIQSGTYTVTTQVNPVQSTG